MLIQSCRMELVRNLPEILNSNSLNLFSMLSKKPQTIKIIILLRRRFWKMSRRVMLETKWEQRLNYAKRAESIPSQRSWEPELILKSQSNDEKLLQYRVNIIIVQAWRKIKTLINILNTKLLKTSWLDSIRNMQCHAIPGWSKLVEGQITRIQQACSVS